MANPNAIRLQTQEGAYTWISQNLGYLLFELDMRINGANCFLTITRDGAGLIDGAKFYMNIARAASDLRLEITFSRTVSAVDGIAYITGVTKTYYNDDGVTVDSTITETATRDALTDDITDCDSPFSTTESTKI